MEPMHFVEAPNNFYLGARVDPDTHDVIQDAVVYYDARDLTTHGVILGMTGSGKTGLGITLLEEAIVDSIPCLIIDPKGDITNLLLAFPDLEPQYFLPWINPDDAIREDKTAEEYAQTVATRWKNGLAEWGIDNKRIQEYRHASRFSIYTPGSDAGLPISILHSLAAPPEGWEGNEEVLRERISGIVTALLALTGMSAKPVEDREHILLSNIFEANWKNHTDLSLQQLILQVQRPPFSKLGVLDLDSVFPEKDRLKLAQSLNNIIAAPNFQSWLKGEPLNIPAMLFTPDGYPRATIFYIAHLNDAERQFITTLLLESIHSWMRGLSGSTSLRALVYIDEVFGMFPPHPYNPPTKEPLMRMLKQARAYGVGLVVATQNPKDIDYKGLSNAGSWFIGKLQTDNDKARVLEGLDSARDATSALDIGTVEKLLGRLGPREFIMHNVHEPTSPILMHTRWSMSYLRGPLTRDQISRLMANQRNLAAQQQPAPAQPSRQTAGSGMMPQQPAPSVTQDQPVFAQAAPAPAPAQPAVPPREEPKKKEEVPPGFVVGPPSLTSSVPQFYLPTEFTVEQAVRDWERITGVQATNVETGGYLLYRPSLLAQTRVRFSHTKTNTSEVYTYAFVLPVLPRVPMVQWEEYVSDPFDPHALETQPFAQAYYSELPQMLDQSTEFTDLQKSLIDWIYYNAALYVYYNPVLKEYSNLYEDQQTFVARVQALAREARDQEIDKVASRYDSKLASLEDRAQKKAARLDAKREESDARKREEMISGAESLMHLMKGRAYYTLSRTSRMRRYTTQGQNQVGLMESDLADITDQLQQTEQEMQDALQAVHDKWVDVARQVEEVKITPYKKDIDMMLFGLGWVPFWEAKISGTPIILPATSSSLAYSQDPNVYNVGPGYYQGPSY